MATAETARLIASLELQDKNFTRGLKGVERGVSRVDKKLGAFSGAVNRNVGRAVDNVTARLLEVPGAVISAAVEQEAAITGISKTIEGDVSAITDELKKLSTETGSTFTELAGIAEMGGAMGIAKDDIAAFTKQVAILGATTNVSVEDAAASLGQLTTILGLSGDELDNFAASLVDLGNKGNSTEAQILEIAKRTGAASKTIGIAKDETLAWASAAANLGLGEELAGTALQKFFVETQKISARGGDDLKELAKIAGMSGKQFKKAFAKDATGALTSFIDGLKDLSAEQRVLAIEDLFGKGSGMTRLLLGLSEALDDPTSGLTASLKTNAEAWEEGTAAQEEADKRFKTSEFLFKRLNNSVNLAAATIGTELLPVLNDLATEGMEWLNKPATQKGIKDFAVGLGKGVRALAGIVTSINWGAVAGFLGTAAGFAGQLVTWFTKMPDWAQAFLIGGFAVTKLPVIGSIVSELGKGLIKGVLGINAGVVNLKAATVVGGGAPVPGGGGAGGVVSKIGSAVRILGAVTIAGASLIALAEVFRGFQETVTTSQKGLLTKVNATNKQGFAETIANLEATSAGLGKLQGLDRLLAEGFGGSEITKNFEMAAGRLVAQFEKGELNRDQVVTAIEALKSAQEQADSMNLETPELDAAIEELSAALKSGKVSNRPQPPSKPLDKVDPQNKVGLGPLIKAGGEQKAELGLIKNAIAATGSTQQAELSNIKNATATLDTNTKAGLIAATAATTAGNLLSVFQSASQVLAQGSTTTAVNTNASATRGVAPPIVSTLLGVGSSITTAIHSIPPPIVSSTTVVNSYGTSQRGGSTSDSRNRGGLGPVG